MSQDLRAERAIQLILNACSEQRYLRPYQLAVTDARGVRIAARIDDTHATQLGGDLASAGVLNPPLKIFITDAQGNCVEFSVELLDLEDGRSLPPIIGYPDEWISSTPGTH